MVSINKQKKAKLKEDHTVVYIKRIETTIRSHSCTNYLDFFHYNTFSKFVDILRK
jgi:hypothetical protein